MKVVFVHSWMPGGGIERVTLTLIENLQDRGVECCLALRRACGDLINEAEALTDVVEIAGSGMQEFVPRLTGLLKDVAPTHLVTAMPDVTMLTLIARWRAGSKACIIQGTHNTQVRAAYADSPGGWWKYVTNRLWARIIYRRVDAIVAVSEGIRKEIIEQFHVGARRVTLIYNPIVKESAIFGARHVASRKDKSFKFVAIGRLSREKGFDVLVRALEQVDGDWTLDIFGHGPEFDSLSALINACGLEGRIRLRGHTDDPYGAIDASDWLILPSRVEGFGMVLIEAFARGVPVIASDCPHGPREIVDNGRLGLLVQADDVDGLASALRQATSGTINFDREQLRRRALDFSESKSVDQWYELFRLIGEQAGVV